MNTLLKGIIKMIDYEALKKMALDCGFSHVGNLDVDTIRVLPEVRAACAENKCQKYGKNWVCPPACGTLEECQKKLRNYKKGLILQSTTEFEDSFDWEGMRTLAKRHNAVFDAFADQLRKQYPNALILGDGACNRCQTCTYPNAPCRFPDRQSSSMEAFGMVVSEVCKLNNIPYHYGVGTLTYIGCVLIE